MNVLMVLLDFYPVIGGTEIQALNLSKALKDTGVSVDILTRMNLEGLPVDEEIKGLPVHRVDYPRVRLLGGILLNMGFAWRLIKSYRHKEIVHFHSGGIHFVLPLLVAKALNKSVIIKIVGAWEMDKGFLKPGNLLNFITRKFLFKADAIIAVSEEIMNRVISLGYPAERVISLPNGVDTSRFCPSGQKSESCRLVFVGRLISIKGVDILLEALKKIRQRINHISLDIVGAGSEEDHLKEIAADMGLAGSVRFLGPRSDVENVLKQADIYVHPSLSEGLPNSLLEAMACALPAVVTRVGGMPDVVEDGVQGIIVEPGNSDELADAICRLAADAKLRAQMGRRNMLFIQHKFSIQKIAASYSSIYEKMATKKL